MALRHLGIRGSVCRDGGGGGSAVSRRLPPVHAYPTRNGTRHSVVPDLAGQSVNPNGFESERPLRLRGSGGVFRPGNWARVGDARCWGDAPQETLVGGRSVKNGRSNEKSPGGESGLCPFTLGSNEFDTQRFKLRGQDSNLRPRGYEPRELPGCSTPRYVGLIVNTTPEDEKIFSDWPCR